MEENYRYQGNPRVIFSNYLPNRSGDIPGTFVTNYKDLLWKTAYLDSPKS